LKLQLYLRSNLNAWLKSSLHIKEYLELFTSLKQNPQQGTPLGSNCYKIRIAIASKGKGKSGGARVITHLQIVQTKIYLLSVYDKSDQSDIKDSDLIEWLRTLK